MSQRGRASLQVVPHPPGPRSSAAAAASELARAASGALAELIRCAVREELGALEPAAARAPALVDRNGLAAALGVSVSTIDRLRGDGVPTVYVADAPRFEVGEVIEFLRKRGARS